MSITCADYSRCILLFFFKQKTAYEMRISDWSSDVCSSDLQGGSDALAIDRVRRARQGGGAQRQAVDPLAAIGQAFRIAAEHFGIGQQMMAKGDRKSVG